MRTYSRALTLVLSYNVSSMCSHQKNVDSRAALYSINSFRTARVCICVDSSKFHILSCKRVCLLCKCHTVLFDCFRAAWSIVVEWRRRCLQLWEHGNKLKVTLNLIISKRFSYYRAHGFFIVSRVQKFKTVFFRCLFSFACIRPSECHLTIELQCIPIWNSPALRL